MDGKKELAEAVTSNGQQNQGFESIQDYFSTNLAGNQVSLRPIAPTRTHKLYAQDGKKVVASIVGATLFQSRKARTSLYRRTNSWAIGLHILERARALDVETVQITDPETGKTYTTALEWFWEHGTALYITEAQRALNLNFWTVSDGRL
jgi:hypothetical protein